MRSGAAAQQGADPSRSPSAAARQADRARVAALAALDRDDVRAALSHANAAVAAARRGGDGPMEGRARLVRARALVFAGRLERAHRELDRAAELVGPEDRGRVELQRNFALYKTGDHVGAMASLERALELLPDDSVDVARVLNNRGVLRMYMGGFAAGLADLREARRRYRALGLAFAAAETLSNIGMMLDRLGDVPGALRALARAEAELVALGAPVDRDVVARAEVQLRAGLYDEVLADVPGAVAALEASGMLSDAAEGALYLAQAQLLAGDPAAAGSARRARLALVRRRRWGWAALARHVQTQAHVERGVSGRRVYQEARAATATLEQAGLVTEARESWVLAGRLAAATGLAEEARLCWRTAARPAGAARSSLHDEVIRAEASARLALAEGRPRAALATCGHGLRLLESHLRSLAATDLRVAAAHRGANLARLGLDIAWAGSGSGSGANAAELLRWAERWRAVALHASPRAEPDRDLAHLLAELRTVSAQARAQLLDAPADRRDPPPDAPDPAALAQRCRELEAAVSRASRQRSVAPVAPGAPVAAGGGTSSGDRRIDAAATPGAGRPGSGEERGGRRPSVAAGPVDRPSVSQLRTALEGRVLVEFVERDGELGAIVVDRRRAQFVSVGPLAPVREASRALQFALRRVALLGGVGAATALQGAHRVHERLRELVALPLARHLRAADLVVVPDAQTHDIPWASILGRDVAVTMAPSAALWMRSITSAQAQRSAPPGRVTLVAGPGLDAAAQEVEEIAALYAPAPTVLTGAAATVLRVGRAAEGAAIVHLAAHGSVRRDNPLFSALELYDGPATVLDLERIRRPPQLIVLAACNSAVGSVAANNDVVGLAAAMLSGGATTVVASMIPLPDRATVAPMVRLHRALARGVAPAHALAELRATARDDDPADFLTTTAWVCLGAG